MYRDIREIMRTILYQKGEQPFPVSMHIENYFTCIIA